MSEHNLLPEWNDLPDECRSALRKAAGWFVRDGEDGQCALDMYNELRKAMPPQSFPLFRDPAPKVPELPAQRRWLSDLIKAAEAFRVAMIQSGATVKVSQNLYFDQLRALECALNPMNYRDDGGQQSAASSVEQGNFMTLVHRYGANPTQEGYDAIYKRYLADCGAAHTTSPEPDAVRETLASARTEVVLAIAFLGRDSFTERLQPTVDSLIKRLVTVDRAILAALPLSAQRSPDPRLFDPTSHEESPPCTVPDPEDDHPIARNDRGREAR